MAHCPDGHASESTDYCDVCGTPIADLAASGTGTPGSSAGTPSAGTTGTSGGEATSSSAHPGQEPGAKCPNCSTVNSSEALFCEACGYDYTTGTLPREAAAGTAPRGAASSVLDLDTPVPGRSDQAATEHHPSPNSSEKTTSPENTSPQQAQPPAVPARTGQSEFGWVAEVWIDPDWYRLQQSPDPLPSPGLPEIFPLRQQTILIGRTSRSRNIHPDIDCEPDSGISRRQARLTRDGERWFVEDLDSANGTYVAGAAEALPEHPLAGGRRQELDADDRIYVGAWTRIVLRHATDEEIDALG